MILPDLEHRAIYERFDFRLDAQSPLFREESRVVLSCFTCPSDPRGRSPVNWVHRTYGGEWGPNNYFGVSGTNALAASLHPSECADKDPRDRPEFRIHSGILFPNSSVRIGQITDGTTTTLMLGERGLVDQFGKWCGPGISGICPWGLADLLLPGAINHPGIAGGLRRRQQDPGMAFAFWGYHHGTVQFAFADGSVRGIAPGIDREVFRRLCTRGDGEMINEW